ncbi:hypothetical protein K794_02419, partial [Salmonella enterica subsp. enterica serovar Newport str. SHSN004]
FFFFFFFFFFSLFADPQHPRTRQFLEKFLMK